jgi:hypothetical protein
MRIGPPASPSTRTSHRPSRSVVAVWSLAGWSEEWKLLATPRRPLSSGRAWSPASVTRRPSSDASVGGAMGCSSCTHSASRLGPLSTGKRDGEAGEAGESGVAGVVGMVVGVGATPSSAAATRRAACSVVRVCPLMSSVIDAPAPSVTCCPASHASSSESACASCSNHALGSRHVPASSSARAHHSSGSHAGWSRPRWCASAMWRRTRSPPAAPQTDAARNARQSGAGSRVRKKGCGVSLAGERPSGAPSSAGLSGSVSDTSEVVPGSSRCSVRQPRAPSRCLLRSHVGRWRRARPSPRWPSPMAKALA